VVDGDAAVTRLRERRDLAPPEVAPGRVAVREQERPRVAGTLIEVEADVARVQIARLERERAVEIAVEPGLHRRTALYPIE
jgi:hypothetical protein